FCPDVSVIQGLCFLDSQGEALFHARRIRKFSDHLLVRPSSDLPFNFHADGFQIETKLFEHIDGDTLTQTDQTKQQVLGAYEVMVEPVGFLARQRKDLLCSGRKVVHPFLVKSCQSRSAWSLTW